MLVAAIPVNLQACPIIQYCVGLESGLADMGCEDLMTDVCEACMMLLF